MGMIHIQEQVKYGFDHLFTQLRTLGSPAQSRKHKSIEYNCQENDDDQKESDDYDDDERIEEITREDSEEEEETEEKFQKEAQEAQKNLVKLKKKEIRVIISIDMLLCLYNFHL